MKPPPPGPGSAAAARLLCFLVTAATVASAQAPLLQDGAAALRQARLDWAQGQAPLEPSSMPSFEVGWGGAGAGGVYAPLLQGEGLGPGLAGWGLGLQGRYVHEGWSFSATVLGLRNHASTRGLLHRSALAYQWESGWRLALEQAPFSWGVSLLDGELLGGSARAFPRLSLGTPETTILSTHWRLEAFTGHLESTPPIPEWLDGRQTRLTIRAAGLDRDHPRLEGALLRGRLGDSAELRFGAVSLDDGSDFPGQPSKRTQSLMEAKVRIPALARALRARGASLQLSHHASPEGSAWVWGPARNLANVLIAWEGWDLGGEYAGAAPLGTTAVASPLAGFSSHGDPLGDAYWRQSITRTLALGLPLSLEGQGHLRVVRATASLGQPNAASAWFLQAEAQWRTSTGRLGASLASIRQEPATQGFRWGWSFSVFQAFRVF